MTSNDKTLLFLNIGHTWDHLAMLIFPTVVLAMTGEFGLDYAGLLQLSIGGFIAFGAGSPPAGWLGDHWDRRGMMILFFLGLGTATIATGFAQGPIQIAVALTFVGLCASIYHPVGLAMLVRGQQARVGQVLGVNGVWGNLGVAFAALSAGGLAEWFGWRWAFIVPGVLCVLTGLAFIYFVPAVTLGAPAGKKAQVTYSPGVMKRVFISLVAVTICGGIIFNATTIAMPKLFEERLSVMVHTTFGVGALVCCVFVLAAVAQLCVGRLIDGRPLRSVFLPFAAVQVPLILIGMFAEGWGMLAAAFAMMFVVFGLIPINDAIVARYVADAWRSRIYAVRYVMSFTGSSLAVPMIGGLHRADGGFAGVFAVLGVLAVGSLAAALLFPAPRNEVAAQPA